MTQTSRNRYSASGFKANVAQLVEQIIRNDQVVRSIRIVGSIDIPRNLALLCFGVLFLRARMRTSTDTSIQHFITSVLVPDRVGLLREITQVVFALKGNIGSIRQTVVDGYFNLVFSSVHPQAVSLATLREQLCAVLKENAVVQVLDRLTSPTRLLTQGARFVVMTRGVDKPGTILAITSFLVTHNVNIEDWLVDEEDGQVVYLAQVVVPHTVDSQALQSAFQQAMAERGLTAMLCHENIFRATNEIGPIKALMGNKSC